MVKLVSVVSHHPEYPIGNLDLVYRENEEFNRFLRKVQDHSFIKRRYSVFPESEYPNLLDLSLKERLLRSYNAGIDLAEKTCEKLLKKTPAVSIADIDEVILATNTCLTSPSIDAVLIPKLGLRKDVKTSCIAMKGCVGGAIALDTAYEKCKGTKKNILVVLVEVHSYHIFHNDVEPTKGRAIEMALFGDGAAACIVSSKIEEGIWSLDESRAYTVPALEKMKVTFDEMAMKTVLYREIHLLATEAAKHLNSMYEVDIDRYLLHPGGKSILQEITKELGLREEQVRDSFQVLEENGNISAATILFVLEEASKKQLSSGYDLLVAFSQGIHAISILLRREI